MLLGCCKEIKLFFSQIAALKIPDAVCEPLQTLTLTLQIESSETLTREVDDPISRSMAFLCFLISFVAAI